VQSPIDRSSISLQLLESGDSAVTTQQKPIESGFGAASTAEEVIAGIDLTGKTAIVTGGYSGLGRETARVLRAAGATVIVPARNLEKAAKALTGIDVEIQPMDLLDPASIDAFAQRFLATGRPLHILVNSAGIMAWPLTRDARGYEAQFATNHLGHFQLTARLRSALIAAKGARVVSVSSWGHHLSPVIFDDPNFERHEYERWIAYGQSKTANSLFAVTLDERDQQYGVRAFAAHPGAVLNTGLSTYVTREEREAIGVIDHEGKPVLDPSQNKKTVQQGASTFVWCATSPQLEGMGGVYCENTDIALVDTSGPATPDTIGESQDRGGVMPYAIDPDAGHRLWALSEQLLHIGELQPT
jgi:NAD(P)-dependent dehydrogenase (short-subunit alcohol dehydrogenase family)